MKMLKGLSDTLESKWLLVVNSSLHLVSMWSVNFTSQRLAATGMMMVRQGTRRDCRRTRPKSMEQM